MRLQTVSLSGRRFSIQFGEILQEFGRVIPWLDGLGELHYLTHPTVFRDRFLRLTKQEEGTITPYQFIEDDQAGLFVGGILLFDKSPERFQDKGNIAIAEELIANGSSFVSCLQIRQPLRQRGHGLSLMTRAINTMVRGRGPVWGVISDPDLISWYQAMGAKILSRLENDDRLWITDFAEPLRR